MGDMNQPNAVTIVNVAEWPWESVHRGRSNSIRRKLLPLDTGKPGVTVELSYMIVPDGYEVPRHRHNCDQIRYILDGVQSIGKNEDMLPGDCGFFPEGAHYGPQAQKGDCLCLLMQFQGASGDRLLTSAELDVTYQKMIAAGAVFKDGVYRGVKPDGSPDNKDSYAAIYEAHEGKKLTFAKPRYRAPILMASNLFNWVADPARPGVETKHLGTFTELATSIGFLRLRADHRVERETHSHAQVRFLQEGSVRYADAAGDKVYSAGTYFYIPPGATTAAMRAETDATFFTIKLPMLKR